MHSLSVVFLLFSIVVADNWAVLVCGSENFWNYRHQADIAHAYQLLKAGGIHPEHIITIMKNDVAYDPMNPFQGELYHHPGNDSPNVYEGIIVDYEQDMVTPDTVKRVLLGDKSIGKKVLESTEFDNVLLYFVNYGGPNILSFPKGLLYSDELMDVFSKMYESKKYNKMVVYAEGSYSGSMFLDLPDNLNILAITSSNEDDSNWSWFCEGEAVVNGQKLDTCLGDEFSLKLLEDADRGIQHTFTLDDQFNKLAEQVSKSHVSRYGDLSFVNDLVGDFFGYPTDNLHPVANAFSFNQMNPRDSESAFLRSKYETTEDDDEMENWRKRMNEEKAARRAVEQYLLGITKERKYYMDGYGVKNFTCYRNAINQFLQEVGQSDYALKLFRVFANMCNDNPNAF